MFKIYTIARLFYHTFFIHFFLVVCVLFVVSCTEDKKKDVSLSNNENSYQKQRVIAKKDLQNKELGISDDVKYDIQTFDDQLLGNYKQQKKIRLAFSQKSFEKKQQKKKSSLDFFDPQAANTTFELQLAHLLYPTMTVLDPVARIAQPALAQSWRVSDAKNGKLRYVFTLRELTWSDALGGEKITAHHVKKSLLRVLAHKFPYANLLAASIDGAYEAYNNILDDRDINDFNTIFKSVEINILSDTTLEIISVAHTTSLLEILAEPAFAILPFKMSDEEISQNDALYTFDDDRNFPKELFTIVESESNRTAYVDRGGAYILRSIVRNTPENEASDFFDSITLTLNDAFNKKGWAKTIELLLYNTGDITFFTKQYAQGYLDYINVSLNSFIDMFSPKHTMEIFNKKAVTARVATNRLVTISLDDQSNILKAIRNTSSYKAVKNMEIIQNISRNDVETRIVQMYFAQLINALKMKMNVTLSEYIINFVQPSLDIYFPFMISPDTTKKHESLAVLLDSAAFRSLFNPTVFYDEVNMLLKESGAVLRISFDSNINSELYEFLFSYLYQYFFQKNITLVNIPSKGDMRMSMVSPYSDNISGIIATLLEFRNDDDFKDTNSQIDLLFNAKTLVSYNKTLESINSSVKNSYVLLPFIYLPSLYFSSSYPWLLQQHQSWLSLIRW